MKKIFIDGKAGTTGLRIYERLGMRADIELITLSEEKRKDKEARKRALNEADVAFLCLPDEASREAVSMIESDTLIIDTSTAHRVSPDWVYGFPELNPNFREEALKKKRIAVPGCHASGFIALIKPLVDAGLIDRGAYLTCHSVTGYSGGGKKMIEEYEGVKKAPRQYGLTQLHKHLPEMKAITGLSREPVFCPIVGDFYSGMMVTVPIFGDMLKGSIEDVKNIYKGSFRTRLVSYEDVKDEGAMLSATAMEGLDSMKLCVYGNGERAVLTAVYDNLGKGASGAAIEALNICLGQDECEGLEI